MAPKFRGGSDDWLDDEESSRNQSGAAPKKRTFASGKAQPLDPALANATVSEVFPRQCRVWMDDGRELACTYRRSAVVGAQTGSEKLRERSPVAAGDRVRVEVVGATDGVIEAACARKKRLLRPAPGREEGHIHVIAANIEVLCIVSAARDPAFSPGLMDRFLVAAAVEKLQPILCINKIDLLHPEDPRPWEYYRQIGLPVMEVSAKYGRGIQALVECFGNRPLAFCGHSGVGKTSLIRALLKTDLGRVGEVSEATGKGRHTTTGAQLVRGRGDAFWIDTPGVREFGLVNVQPEELHRYFPELDAVRCQEPGCLHLDEPGCGARELPRHASYRRIYDSLASGEH